MRELEHVISRAAIKAVSRGANRNHIVTLEASLLDLSGADLRPLAPAPDAPPATTPDGVLPACATPWTPASASTSGWRCKHDGNWAAAARVLEVDPSNLHKLARRLGLKG